MKAGPLKLSMRITEFFVVMLAFLAFAKTVTILLQGMTYQERVLWDAIMQTNIPAIIVLACAAVVILPFYGYAVLTRWLEKRDLNKIEKEIERYEAALPAK